MNLKLYVLVVSLVIASCYDIQDGVIILKNEDLTKMTKQFPLLLVQYYVPWCTHCQRLAPIYSRIAQQLQAQNSPIKLAKIDCQDQTKAYQFGQISHFPTLKFYSEGSQIEFDGDRTYHYLYKWLSKRIKSPITQITHQQLLSFRTLNQSDVKVIYFGPLTTKKGSQFTNLAYVDNYNSYYNIQQQINPQGTIQIIRPFDTSVSSMVSQGNIQNWVRSLDRPAVVPLDQRSITHIFRDGHIGLLFFIDKKYEKVLSIFTEAAKLWKNTDNHSFDLTFIAVEEQHEDYFGLSQYLEVHPLESPIAIINGEKQIKYKMKSHIKSLTTEKIIEFIQNVIAGNIQSEELEHHHDHDHDHHHDHDHDHHHDHHGHHDHHHHHHHNHDHDHDHHHHDHGHEDHHRHHHQENESQNDGSTQTQDDSHDHSNCNDPDHHHHHHHHHHEKQKIEIQQNENEADKQL